MLRNRWTGPTFFKVLGSPIANYWYSKIIKYRVLGVLPIQTFEVLGKLDKTIYVVNQFLCFFVKSRRYVFVYLDTNFRKLYVRKKKLNEIRVNLSTQKVCTNLITKHVNFRRNSLNINLRIYFT